MLYQELIPLTALLQGQTDFPGLACPGRRPREHQQVGEVGCSPLRGSSAWKAVSSLLSGGAGGTSNRSKGALGCWFSAAIPGARSRLRLSSGHLCGFLRGKGQHAGRAGGPAAYCLGFSSLLPKGNPALQS
uniref:Uncharacterized protein n=1 Tax=Rousettus aegyptiacus TaxID=9407 RepID=A0A7J8GB65_ROUAE|nr:hypothetical protein HJG63_011713 [Rousettus aegyptiacus]